MNNDRRDILLRFGIVYVVILAVAVAIVFKIIDIQVFERPIWMKLASRLTQADREAPATRGNIFAADGELLASTLPKYYLYMLAKKGDVVLIAGKGHEDYQIVKGVKHHFDDKEVVRSFFVSMQ